MRDTPIGGSADPDERFEGSINVPAWQLTFEFSGTMSRPSSEYTKRKGVPAQSWSRRHGAAEGIVGAGQDDEKRSAFSVAPEIRDPMTVLCRNVLDCLLRIEGMENEEVRGSLFKLGFERWEYSLVLQSRSNNERVDLANIVKMGKETEKLDVILDNACMLTNVVSVQRELEQLKLKYLRFIQQSNAFTGRPPSPSAY